jgi:hypothetical protein
VLEHATNHIPNVSRNNAKNLKMKHILFQKALVYKKRKEITPPKNYEYDHILGAWKDKLSNLLINSTDFKAQATKKLDIETGEDNKGQ